MPAQPPTPMHSDARSPVVKPLGVKSHLQTAVSPSCELQLLSIQDPRSAVIIGRPSSRSRGPKSTTIHKHAGSTHRRPSAWFSLCVIYYWFSLTLTGPAPHFHISQSDTQTHTPRKRCTSSPQLTFDTLTFLFAFLLPSYAAAVPVDGYTPAGTAPAKARPDGASAPSHPRPRLHLLRGDVGAPVVATHPVIESEPSTAGKVARADTKRYVPVDQVVRCSRAPTYVLLAGSAPDRHSVALFAPKPCVYPSSCPHFPISKSTVLVWERRARLPPATGSSA
ncbi:hypothetical protein C8R44DRAFT_880854 [Mycena epipterygia]|nr:hypothetical protein C8R44DRAFT_880854 [Mycena epipterygia]